MKTPYKILIITSSFLALNLLAKALSGNFEESDLIPPSTKDLTLNKPESFSVESVLDQKFYFLAKGHQAIVFTSADGKHVLKLLKLHYPQISLPGVSFHFTHIPFAKSLYKLLFKEKLQGRINKDFISYTNALEKFQEESLVSYIHLAESSHLDKRIQCYDKRGTLHVFSADKTCFLIQENVPSLQGTLKQFLFENKIKEAKIVLQNLVTLINLRASLHFYRPTHKFYANFGCVGLKPIQYDIGNLLRAEDLHLAAPEEKSIQFSFYKLKKWIEKDFPELSSYIEELTKDTDC